MENTAQLTKKKEEQREKLFKAIYAELISLEYPDLTDSEIARISMHAVAQWASGEFVGIGVNYLIDDSQV